MKCPYCKTEIVGEYWQHLAYEPPQGCVMVSTALGKYWPYSERTIRANARDAESLAEIQARNESILEDFFDHRKPVSYLTNRHKLGHNTILRIITDAQTGICIACREKPVLKNKHRCGACERKKFLGMTK